MQFDSFGFHPTISANIKSLGYEAPTPIQAEAMPHVLEGRDVMGLAQTGTGKTAAFLLPIIDKFMKDPKPLRGTVRALVIAPTRELAEQISESARDYTKGARIRTVTVYGGVGLGPQANRLRQGADILVACPGRLLDHLNQGNANLSGVETLVLDEADHMFDMGFLPDIRRILSTLPKERQTLLFSATMPDSIRGLANETLKNPALVRIGRTAPASTVEQCLFPVPQHLKTKLLLNLLEQNPEGSVLVFTRTKHRAKRLAEQLERSSHTSACLQGNLSQTQRQKAMDGFRTGRYRVLVATDIAARGIDVSRVAHVVNFDLPDTPETYTHRVGRTGRAEREGQAYSLVTHEDNSMVRAIERLLGKTIERKKMDGFDYAVPAPERHSDFDRPIMRPGGRGGFGGGNNNRRSEGGQGQGQRRPAREGYSADTRRQPFSGDGVSQPASQPAAGHHPNHHSGQKRQGQERQGQERQGQGQYGDRRRAQGQGGQGAFGNNRRQESGQGDNRRQGGERKPSFYGSSMGQEYGQGYARREEAEANRAPRQNGNRRRDDADGNRAA
ncbi:DEAD/DEAH box helicase [Fundidesulfovibrio agrisoli]|uniref:DEAD/DEAH box helicase n=1 Tax=Fundidesulfovibrio agrisoli TaxID=2922717 RepID=UPI001FAD3990|nr:DEAD/DEAH box helicase [Fundidesulfovibrio agrisoli]